MGIIDFVDAHYVISKEIVQKQGCKSRYLRYLPLDHLHLCICISWMCMTMNVHVCPVQTGALLKLFFWCTCVLVCDLFWL